MRWFTVDSAQSCVPHGETSVVEDGSDTGPKSSVLFWASSICKSGHVEGLGSVPEKSLELMERTINDGKGVADGIVPERELLYRRRDCRSGMPALQDAGIVPESLLLFKEIFFMTSHEPYCGGSIPSSWWRRQTGTWP